MENLLNHLLWVEEFLPSEIVPRKMYGGIGYYLDEKLVLILVECSLTYEHKGVSYPFQLWNGCVFPVEKIKQSAVWVKYQYLENHPANKNWLYLPADAEEVEEKIKSVLREIKKRNSLFGLPIKMAASVDLADDLDASQPRMFTHGTVTAEAKARAKAKTEKTVKKEPKKVKANKKRENAFVLSVLNKKK